MLGSGAALAAPNTHSGILVIMRVLQPPRGMLFQCGSTDILALRTIST